MTYPFTAIVALAFIAVSILLMVARLWWLDNKEETQ